MTMGSEDCVRYLFKQYNNSIKVTVNTKFKFSNFGLSHRTHRGSEVTMGPEDPLQFFERAYLFKRGKVEHILTMANLKLNPTPFMPRPNIYSPQIILSIQRIPFCFVPCFYFVVCLFV